MQVVGILIKESVELVAMKSTIKEKKSSNEVKESNMHTFTA